MVLDLLRYWFVTDTDLLLMWYWFVLEVCPRQLANVGINYLNNG